MFLAKSGKAGSTTESGRQVEEKAEFTLGGRAHGALDSSLINSSLLGPSHEVGIRTDWLRAQDLYVILEQQNGNGTVIFQILVKPLINLIWIAGFLFLFGSLVALWPDAREQRRLVARLALARG